MYYYKNGLSTLNVKTQLSASEIGDWEEITETEYNQIIASITPTITEPSETELRIKELKALLRTTDYQAIKYAEGWISETDYAPIKAQRQAYRDEINELQGTSSSSSSGTNVSSNNSSNSSTANFAQI